MRFVLDVYDWLHFFGHDAVTFDRWRLVFRRDLKRDSALRSWERFKQNVRKRGVAHERVRMDTDWGNKEVALRLLPGARQYVETRLPRVSA